MKTETELGKEMIQCWISWTRCGFDHRDFSGCRLLNDPDEFIPEYPDGYRYWTLRNGDSMTIGGLTIPLSSSFIPCEKHLAILKNPDEWR
jgi:hypothetical protein